MPVGPATVSSSNISGSCDGNNFVVPSVGGKQQNFAFSGASATCTGASASQPIAHTTLAVTFQLITLLSVTACVCTIQGSNDPTLANWVNLGTITVNSASGSDGFALSAAAYSYFRANVTTLTGGSCQVVMGQ